MQTATSSVSSSCQPGATCITAFARVLLIAYLTQTDDKLGQRFLQALYGLATIKLQNRSVRGDSTSYETVHVILPMDAECLLRIITNAMTCHDVPHSAPIGPQGARCGIHDVLSENAMMWDAPGDSP